MRRKRISPTEKSRTHLEWRDGTGDVEDDLCQSDVWHPLDLNEGGGYVEE
jgi:hypothetical protein